MVECLQMVDAMFVVFGDAEHHGRGGADAELVRGSMDVDPITGEAFQASDFVANFVVENFGAAARNGVESGIAQADNRVADAERAVLGDSDDFGGGVAVEMD